MVHLVNVHARHLEHGAVQLRLHIPGQIAPIKILEIRESQKWKPGQKFAFVPRGTGYVLVPVPTFEELAGIAKGANTDNVRNRNDRY